MHWKHVLATFQWDDYISKCTRQDKGTSVIYYLSFRYNIHSCTNFTITLSALECAIRAYIMFPIKKVHQADKRKIIICAPILPQLLRLRRVFLSPFEMIAYPSVINHQPRCRTPFVTQPYEVLVQPFSSSFLSITQLDYEDMYWVLIL